MLLLVFRLHSFVVFSGKSFVDRVKFCDNIQWGLVLSLFYSLEFLKVRCKRIVKLSRTNFLVYALYILFALLLGIKDVSEHLSEIFRH